MNDQNTDQKKLRIGILCESRELPAWTNYVIDTFASSQYAELVLIVIANRQNPKEGFLGRLWRGRRKLIYFLYDKLDRIVFRSRIDAFAKSPLDEAHENVEELLVAPIESGYSDFFPDDSVSEIKSKEIDVLLRFGFRILRGPILSAARYGVWSCHHGDNRVNRGGPPGYWEVLQNWPVTGSILQMLSEQLDGGHILYRSWSRTDQYSISRNKNQYYWKTSEFILRSLRDIHKFGEKQFIENTKLLNDDLTFYDRPLYRAPTNITATRLAVQKLWQFAKRGIEKSFFVDQWFLLYSFSEKPATSMRQFRYLMPPKDRFWADPFIMKRDDKFFVFFEEFITKNGKAHISVMELDENGIASDIVEILVRPYHLSFPYIFEWADRLFMIPESASNRSIELYECTKFPHEWTFVHYIMTDVDAVDTSIFEHDGKWWLFCGWGDNKGMSHDDELFVFHADNPLSQNWVAHTRNPVVSDVRNSRPAGRLMHMNDRLIRPSQNGSKTYGYGFNINHVTLLTETEFEESEIDAMTPDWDKSISRTHTYNFVSGLTIGDAMTRRRKFF